MNNAWKSPKTILGPVATGGYYYPRTEITNEIWHEIEKGTYILIAAPRRVGKTSIMRAIEENPRENYKVKFESIQGVKSEKEFYKTVHQLILTCLSTSEKLTKSIIDYIKKIKISELDIKGKIKIEANDLDYLKEINTIFRDLDESSETVVLLLDELPEVLHNLNKAGKREEAISILKQLRVWRQSDYKKLQFIFAGSIGIHYVVKAIEGRTSDLNDLKKVICNPLNKDEALNYIDWATKDATVKYDDELKEYLLKSIQHYYTPYFINLMLDEIDRNARKKNNDVTTETDIDAAFNQIVKTNEHFADWKSRLAEYMPKEDFDFVNHLLTHIAHKDSINIQTIYDKAISNGKEGNYMDYINDLEQDGYIVTEENQNYIYISPFLKAFWKQNNPIYNG